MHLMALLTLPMPFGSHAELNGQFQKDLTNDHIEPTAPDCHAMADQWPLIPGPRLIDFPPARLQAYQPELGRCARLGGKPGLIAHVLMLLRRWEQRISNRLLLVETLRAFHRLDEAALEDIGIERLPGWLRWDYRYLAPYSALPMTFDYRVMKCELDSASGFQPIRSER